MHHYQVNSELEDGTNDVRGVSIRDQRVGNVLSTYEEMIHEHSQAEQLTSWNELSSTRLRQLDCKRMLSCVSKCKFSQWFLMYFTFI
jgi:hypothetical protein